MIKTMQVIYIVASNPDLGGELFVCIRTSVVVVNVATCIST